MRYRSLYLLLFAVAFFCFGSIRSIPAKSDIRQIFENNRCFLEGGQESDYCQGNHFVDHRESVTFAKVKVLRPFSEGLASAVETDSKAGAITTPEDLRPKCGYIDKTGQWAIQPQEGRTSCGVFTEGLAPVAFTVDKNDRFGSKAHWGYIDKTGQWVIPPVYQSLNDSRPFSEGVAVVEREYPGQPAGSPGQQLVIDKTGKIHFTVTTKFHNWFESQSPYVYSWIDSNFHNGLARVTRVHFSLWDRFMGLPHYYQGYINKQGKVIIPTIYDKTSDFVDKMAIVELTGNPGKKQIIDTRGKVLISVDRWQKTDLALWAEAVQKFKKSSATK